MGNPLKNLFRARDEPIEKRGVTDYAPSDAMEFTFGGSPSGKAVTPRTSIQISTVYACVRVLAETVASLPFYLNERTGETGGRHATDHPLYFLLHDEPNGEMTSFTWRETMMTHLALWGNSYNQIIYNGRGKPTAIYPLLPDKMTVERDEDGNIVYLYATKDGMFYLKPDEVLHVPGLGFDGLVGYSPIAIERNALGLTLAAEDYGSRFFANGARPSGVLTHPGTVKDTKKLREAWSKAYGGASNTGKTVVLEEGMKYEAISMPNNEAQFLETRKFQVSEICRIYRVPPHMVGDLEHATYSNIEHQSIGFAQYTIAPWCARIEQASNRSVLRYEDRKRYYSHFNLDGLMRGDYKSRMEGYAIARNNGWMSTNDIRSREDMTLVPEEEGGNAYGVNGNMIPLKRLLDLDYVPNTTTDTGKEGEKK